MDLPLNIQPILTFRTAIGILILMLVSFTSMEVKAQTEIPTPEAKITEFPEQIGFVNDFEKLFTEEESKFLEDLLAYYEKNVNREIAIITLDSIPEDRDFDQYAIQLSDHWQVGENNDGNGLSLLLSKSLRKIRISTTDKTRDLYLSDEFCKKVIDETMIPEFKKGNYYNGILLGLKELIRIW